MIQKIDDLIFSFKMHRIIKHYESEDKKMRTNYCRKGFHKLQPQSVGYRNGLKERMKYIRFLKCQYCNYKFFAKKSDKERYLKYVDKNQATTKEILSALLKSSSSAKPKRQ